MKLRLLFLFFWGVSLNISTFAQVSEARPWEKYGMSQVEWKKFKESNLTLNDLEELLKMGITLNEFLSRPWISMQISKHTWMTQRQQGMSNEDIEAFFGEKQKGDYRIFYAFLVPGLMQLRFGEPIKSGAMFLPFVAFPLLYAFIYSQDTISHVKEPEKEIGDPQRHPLFLAGMLATMIVSSADAYITINKTKQQKATLSMDMDRRQVPMLRLTYRF